MTSVVSMLNQGTISITNIIYNFADRTYAVETFSPNNRSLQGIEYLYACIFLYSLGNFIAQVLFCGITRPVY